MEYDSKLKNIEAPLKERSFLKMPKSWIIALCLLAFGTTLYTEIEGRWFPSYASIIAKASYFNVAIIVAMSGVIGTCFYLIWGAVSDNLRTKIGRRVPIILTGMLISAGLMVLFVLTTIYLILLIIGGILLAITTNMFHVTNKSLIADLVPVEKRGRINALLVVFSTSGSIAVWVPALVLLPEGEGTYSREIHMLFIGGGALILVLVGVFVWQLVKEPKITTPPHNWFKDLTNLFDRKEMAKNKDFLRLFLAMMFLITSESAFFPFLLILLQEIPLDFSGMIVPFVIVIAGVGLGIFLIGRGVDVVGRKPIALICLIISPIGCLILTFFGTNYLGLIIGFGVMMPFYMGIWLTTDSWTLDLLPEQSRGRFLGIKNIGNAVGKVPGVLLAGFLADQFGILWVFFVAGIILWISIPFFLKVPETLKREKVK